jgi:hypothetical protein
VTLIKRRNFVAAFAAFLGFGGARATASLVRTHAVAYRFPQVRENRQAAVEFISGGMQKTSPCRDFAATIGQNGLEVVFYVQARTEREARSAALKIIRRSRWIAPAGEYLKFARIDTPRWSHFREISCFGGFPGNA